MRNGKGTGRGYLWSGALFAVLALVFLVLMQETVGLERKVDETVKLTSGWYYIDEAGAKRKITLPCKFEGYTKPALEIYYEGDPSKMAGKYLSFKGALYRVEIYLGDELIYRFRDTVKDRNEMVLSDMVCITSMPSNLHGKEFKFKLDLENQSHYEMGEVRCGTLGGIYKSFLMENLFSISAGVIMVVAGLLCIGISFVVDLKKKVGRELFYISIYLVTCGLWSLLDCGFVQMLFGYDNVLIYMGFYLFDLILLPLLLYVLEIKALRKYRIFSVFLALNLANVGIQSILCLAGKFTLYQMLPVTQVLFLFMIVAFAVVSARADKKDMSEDIRLFMRGFKVAGGFSIVAMICYMVGLSFYRVIFQIGIILFIGLIIYGLAQEIWTNMQYRAKADYYQRIAEEDRLTRLKNQRAFDMLMYDIEKDRENYKNAVMVYVDVNDLKSINDRYGHEAGNRTIVAAARCIRDAYADCGFCYRIGGDAFAAVIHDGLLDWDKIADALEHAVRSYNASRGADCELSIAYGMSRLADFETVEEWKDHAEKEMYRNKKSGGRDA